MVFGNTVDSEKAVNKLRDTVKRYVQNPLLKGVPWQELLSPLSVHSEGKILYVQWSSDISTVLKLVEQLRIFVEKNKKNHV